MAARELARGRRRPELADGYRPRNVSYSSEVIQPKLCETGICRELVTRRKRQRFPFPKKVRPAVPAHRVHETGTRVSFRPVLAPLLESWFHRRSARAKKA